MWGRAGTDATPAAFNLGLCRLRGILSPPSATTTFRRRATCRHDAAGGPFYLRAQRCRRNCSSLLRRLLQAELIYFAATKIRIGRGNVATTTSQAGYSTCRYDGAAGGSVLVRSIDCSRRAVLLCGKENQNRTQQRSGNDFAGGLFFSATRWCCSDS